MIVRTLLNAILNDYKWVKIMDYIGEENAIGADLDTDYGEVGLYYGVNDIPNCLYERNVEYFCIEDDKVTIFMVAQ